MEASLHNLLTSARLTRVLTHCTWEKTTVAISKPGSKVGRYASSLRLLFLVDMFLLQLALPREERNKEGLKFVEELTRSSNRTQTLCLHHITREVVHNSRLPVHRSTFQNRSNGGPNTRGGVRSRRGHIYRVRAGISPALLHLYNQCLADRSRSGFVPRMLNNRNRLDLIQLLACAPWHA